MRRDREDAERPNYEREAQAETQTAPAESQEDMYQPPPVRKQQPMVVVRLAQSRAIANVQSQTKE